MLSIFKLEVPILGPQTLLILVYICGDIEHGEPAASYR